jgi:hypothetical protein
LCLRYVTHYVSRFTLFLLSDNNRLQGRIGAFSPLFDRLQPVQLVVPEAGTGAGSQSGQDNTGRQGIHLSSLGQQLGLAIRKFNRIYLRVSHK